VLTPLQLSFLRNLSTYHATLSPEALSKEQLAAFEQLQAQLKRAAGPGSSTFYALGAAEAALHTPGAKLPMLGSGVVAAHTLPSTEMIEEVEDIEEC